MATTLDPARVLRDVDNARAALHSGDAVTATRRYRALLRRLEREAPADADLLTSRVRVMLGLALCEWETSGDLTASLLGIDATERFIEESGTFPHLLVIARGQRGLMLLRSGDVPAALAALDRAVELLDEADVYDQMSVLLNRSALHLELHSLAAAKADLERCASIAARSGDGMMAFKSEHNLGYVEFLGGRIPRALAALEHAVTLNPGDPHPISFLDRARVLREAGLIRDADSLLGEAAALLRQGRQFQDLAETELDRAECALVDGDPKRARAFAASALRRFSRRGNLRWQRKAELLVLRCDRSLADLRSAGARSRALRAVAVEALDLAVSCRAEDRADLARSAELIAWEALLRAGDDVEGSPSLRPTDSLQTRLQVHEVRALAATRRGDLRRAGAEVRRGLAELGSYQNRFGSLDLRTASAVHGVALAKLQLDLAMADGRPSEVFAGIERARAVSTRLAHVRPPSDERTAELLAELRQVEEEARALAGESGATEQLARMRAEVARLQREIRSRAWEVEGGAEEPLRTSARLGPVRDAAGERAFATYARHHGRWVAVVAVGRRVELLELAAVAEIDELVRRVRADLDAVAMPRLPEPILVAIRASIASTLRRLDDLLLRPLRVEGRSLVVSCSGSLVVLPWSLLPSRAGLPMVVTPSATSWLAVQEVGRPAAVSAVAIGGPDLHLATSEAKQVGAAWTGSTSLVEQQATVAAAHEALREAHVVHIAAHGTHRQDNPLFSSIRLVDGQLYAYEMDADSHIAPLVALSACEAGLATVRPGDEGLGLTNVLLQLGTQSVLAGVARVRDDVAAEVMLRVHHGMASGMDSAGALAAAQADCADAGVPVPFLCFGSSW
ncbi:MAG TPA: CHAT domain-containing protein [Nocardioidaceae bacterium]|nr:CHAT domain-containing protein [Nocardioidaceae bacterium]